MLITELRQDCAKFNDLCLLLCSNVELKITRREAEILAMMMLYEWPVSRIAEHLCREEKTVNKHICNIKKKVSCSTLFTLGVKISKHISKLSQNS
jgi:DNA-binding NarL/FixJ family response regulator